MKNVYEKPQLEWISFQVEENLMGEGSGSVGGDFGTNESLEDW